MLLRSDLHMHNADFSGDAQSSMAEMCEGAIAKGLERICFTDHVDFDIHYDDMIPFDPEAYDVAIKKVQDKYGDRLEILKGIEVGEAQKYPKEYEKVLKYEYDMVIASIHYIDIPMGLHWMGDEGKDVFFYATKRIYRRYYEDVLALVNLGGFDVLGHIDHPKRYLRCDAHEPQLLEDILKTLLQKKMVLEINTSLLRECDEPSPGKHILDMYKQLGGERLTMGCDAHVVKNIASHLEDGLPYAEGFRLGYFKERTFYPIGLEKPNKR